MSVEDLPPKLMKQYDLDHKMPPDIQYASESAFRRGYLHGYIYALQTLMWLGEDSPNIDTLMRFAEIDLQKWRRKRSTFKHIIRPEIGTPEIHRMIEANHKKKAEGT